MDTPSLLSINCEIPKEEVIISNLPPNLGLLPDSSGNLSYNYFNILELENVITSNHTQSLEMATFNIAHIYDPIQYQNFIIDVVATDEKLASEPGEPVETGLRWVDMTPYQIFTMINNETKELINKELFTFDYHNMTYTIELPPGISIYFCHSLIWEGLGLYDILKPKLVKYSHPTEREKGKFSRSLRKSITGLQNKSSFSSIKVTGLQVGNERLIDDYADVVFDILNEGDVTKGTRFYGIITFPKTTSFYTEFYTKKFPLQLLPLNSNFISTLKQSIIEYSQNILDIREEDSFTIEDIFRNEFDIIVEQKAYMLFRIINFRLYNQKGIRVMIILGSTLYKYLGKKYIEVGDSYTINTTNHKEIIKNNVFGYPLYLILLSTDSNNEFEHSVINNAEKNILAIIHSETEFSTTQSLIKLRPSTFNKLVFKIVNKDFQKVSQKISCKLIFRFKREFLEDNLSLHFFKNDEMYLV